MKSLMNFSYCIMENDRCVKAYLIPYPSPDEVKTHEEFVKWCEDHSTPEFEKKNGK